MRPVAEIAQRNEWCPAAHTASAIAARYSVHLLRIGCGVVEERRCPGAAEVLEDVVVEVGGHSHFHEEVSAASLFGVYRFQVEGGVARSRVSPGPVAAHGPVRPLHLDSKDDRQAGEKYVMQASEVKFTGGKLLRRGPQHPHAGQQRQADMMLGPAQEAVDRRRSCDRADQQRQAAALQRPERQSAASATPTVWDGG